MNLIQGSAENGLCLCAGGGLGSVCAGKDDTQSEYDEGIFVSGTLPETHLIQFKPRLTGTRERCVLV